MKRNYPSNPLLQPIKGIFVLNQGEEVLNKTVLLLKVLRCEVMSQHENRITVKTSRGNLQAIKQTWLSKEDETAVGKELSDYVSQIIIGGNAK